MPEDSECFSLIEKVINKGPFPNAKCSIFARVLNTLIISCIFLIAGYMYTIYSGMELLNTALIPQRYSVEIIIALIGAFLFSYTHLLYLSAIRVKKYFVNIRAEMIKPMATTTYKTFFNRLVFISSPQVSF